ncbi:DsbE family thiol:disulfide interchange protein [Pseudomarimonas arenosa]|uniref:DsbE family thiol:disulfide interchange protein n=1 Tax=Pseudomarimonas arenosa TaxID=2774145 RepID=A0AAW3ZJC9_9GAMM|nr:DsbE family thiol:disulfide interchange protein [Pseudomarimonas arenosa]MBD8525324.1 DsbE family thiol:disulfide interchange protein [Pseudomarimonas arenosa]
MIQRWLPLLAFLALAVLLYAGVRLSGEGDQSVIPSPLIGKPAPSFDLPDYRDVSRTISNADLAGQPYLLNVWASWCPACRLEHPIITEIARRGLVRVVGYNYKDEPAEAQRWLQQFGDPYDLIIVDADGRSAIDWGIYGAPETFLVDANGQVIFKHVGPVTWDVVTQELMPRLSKETP